MLIDAMGEGCRVLRRWAKESAKEMPSRKMNEIIHWIGSTLSKDCSS